MSTLSSDTRPEAEQKQLELLRQAPPWRKLSNSRFGNCAADNYSAGLIFAGVRAELAELTNQNSIILEILL